VELVKKTFTFGVALFSHFFPISCLLLVSLGLNITVTVLLLIFALGVSR